MDDLSSLDWSLPSSAKAPQTTSTNTASSTFCPPLRPTPSPFASGRNTPLSAIGSGASGSAIGVKPPITKPAQDSFSNLVNFSSGKSGANLTLREQQERLEAEKRKKEEEARKRAQAQYGDGQFWDSLGQRTAAPATSRTASPAIAPPPPAFKATGVLNGKPQDPDEDLFAAFKAETQVDNSSYYPPPTTSAKASGLDLSNPHAWNQGTTSSGPSLGDDDDDPFGLNQLKPTTASAPQPSTQAALDDDDDLLGDLGKPVDQVRRKQPEPSFTREPEPGKPIEDSSSDSEVDEQGPGSDDPFEKAVAQLVDYGFSPDQARRGLTESGAGINVQAAANWLLDDAHRQAKAKAKARSAAGEQARDGSDERTSSRSRNGGPAWMREGGVDDGSRSRDNRSPASADGDLARTAAAVGTSFLKTANSLWKTGQKKVQKAVAEFQQDGDPSQPKWMRSTQQERMEAEARQAAEVTDEALMLEPGMRPGRRPAKLGPEARASSNVSSRDQSPAMHGPGPVQGRSNPVPKWQQSNQSSSLDPRSRLSKQAIEEQSAQAYVSPARRKKAATPQPQPEPQPEPQRPAEPEPDLLFNSTALPTSRPAAPSRPAQSSAPTPRQAARPSPSPAPRSAPAARPPRQIPNVSAIALQSSTKHRLDGTAHFKRGDYAAAHASYSSSLAAIPQTHPLAILLLCNRALTSLKTGEPRQAVEDADSALALIGPGKGEGEHVELQDNNEKRDMRELYGKALTRKAEALEQMEKWADAGTVWQICVESGLGGPTATAGRQRCQKALAPKPAVKPTPKPTPAAARPRPRPAAAGAAQSSGQDSEAVQRLRAANQAADREGTEKLALVDKVDARVAAWRDGKRDNLRALLGSLDNVLWEGSGWKKVGLHELVMANKVKIIYMKAIAKTHPDKLDPNANTEVRMLAGFVFSTLNEAWDKFKAENGL
ncbi:hypothetical protein QBC46DRAFT_278550 [Diplogelasinospora grovesii]|uniref:UBA domain-containing protein n=1 Tax=Diplogelasinospora grovesii TaxID=303347 RepID=A0AAN6S9N4_9PEZI|nr:hypothetical protein QBC46DRAFT_278550 [Diplogelasinospora grovesii]